MTYDAIVIGMGSMGSSAAYHLAARGQRVLGLEQFNIGHDLGSGHGITRVIRLAYFEDPAYVPLLRRAYALWRKIQKLAGEPLLFVKGGLDVGPVDGAVVTGSIRSCREHKLKHELLDAGEVNRRFPGWRLPKSMCAVYQPQGGFVLCDRTIISYVRAAQTLGAEIHGCERVMDWEAARSGVVVRTDRATYRAKRLVVTAGAWASKLVSEVRQRKLAVPQRQVLIWTQPRMPEHFQPDTFPVFNMECAVNGDLERWYGCPVYGVPGVKIGKYYHRRQMVDPDRVERNCDAEDERVLRAGIQRFFPQADGPTMAMKTCLFSMSPDEHFVIDRHPSFPQVTIAAGFSGHGFKFASVVGELLTDLALEGGSARFPDLSLFSLTRERVEAD